MNGRWNIDPNVIRFKILRCSSFVCLLALKWRERILCCRLRAMRHIHVEIGPNFRFDWNCFHSIFFFYSRSHFVDAFSSFDIQNMPVFSIFIFHVIVDSVERRVQVKSVIVMPLGPLFLFSSIDCVISIDYFNNFRQGKHLF